MIDFYYWPTPNGWKVSILLEELVDALGIDYTMIPVNIGKGDQFKPDFLKISPNNRMPAIVDHAPPAEYGTEPVSVFESGAIMIYLADKFGSFIPKDPRGRKECLEWLFWQTGNQGPMGGQLSHFVNYAPGRDQGDNAYSAERYANEYDRCLGVLDRRLEGRRFILGDDYTIADMINWPWVLIAKPMLSKSPLADTPSMDLSAYPNLSRWRSEIKERPPVQRGVDLGKESRRSAPPSDEERKVLFGQKGK
ncbi:thiol:disulfide oxidoreductase [Hwanghaeella grinnelliae]|uniref:Thiol:disulfide oxidoreductase n=1 Tax=Hwanghaeella grinnelliae TaxID=2500179 RepID=A0A3S2W8G5_9PROT|nr:glutathione S-transferase C-terminal domain-containing protein [Hwanghaeella grinnelliae]RVU39791.1 thiol:disulfide oxidoreductase [Hwanghaeella grinnelliae]